MAWHSVVNTLKVTQEIVQKKSPYSDYFSRMYIENDYIYIEKDMAYLYLVLINRGRQRWRFISPGNNFIRQFYGPHLLPSRNRAWHYHKWNTNRSRKHDFVWCRKYITKGADSEDNPTIVIFYKILSYILIWDAFYMRIVIQNLHTQIQSLVNTLCVISTCNQGQLIRSVS